VTIETVGFVGLGNMGSVLASNLAERGFRVVVHDARGAVRAPMGTEHVVSVAEVTRRAETSCSAFRTERRPRR
jgi:3-hydroxyisobutyrate dehydrogenase-like beta-hydroxyacid dehydrogenase